LPAAGNVTPPTDRRAMVHYRVHRDPKSSHQQISKLVRELRLSPILDVGAAQGMLGHSIQDAGFTIDGIEIINNFGSNEGLALVSGPSEAPDPEARSRLFPRFGRPELDWPQRIARITHTRLVDPENGKEIVEPHRPGEMQIRGPVVFDGYFGVPEVTARAFTADGWFRTGDLFEIDASGRYYQFVARLKQLINRGGVKISPDEIDAVLAEHPDIAEASVVGYPDDVLGERICAVVVPKAGKVVTVETLQAHFRSRELAVFKWPERVRIVERLPRNPLGKVIRGEISQIAAT